MISCWTHLSCTSTGTWRSTWPLYARTQWRFLGSSRWSPEAREDRGHRGTSSTWSALTSPPLTRPPCPGRLQHLPIFTQEEGERPRTWRTVSRTSATCTRPLTHILTHTHTHTPTLTPIRLLPTRAAQTCTQTSPQVDTITRLRPTTLCPNQWTAPRCSPSCRSTEASTSRAARGTSRRLSPRGSPSRIRWTPSGCLRLSRLSTPSGTLRSVRPHRPPMVRWPPPSPATRTSL